MEKDLFKPLSYKESERYMNDKFGGWQSSWLLGFVTIAPVKVKMLLNAHDHGPGDKTSAEWCFAHRDSNCLFRLYEYKNTSQYDSDLMSPEDFWNNENEIQLNIGGSIDNDDPRVDQFRDWLRFVTNNPALVSWPIDIMEIATDSLI